MRLSPKRSANRARSARLRKSSSARHPGRSLETRTWPCAARSCCASSPRDVWRSRRLAIDQAEPLDQDVGVLVEHRLKAAGDAVVEHRLPVRLRASHERRHLRQIEEAAQPPGDPRCAVAHRLIGERGGPARDSRQGAQRDDSRPGESDLRDDLDQVVWRPSREPQRVSQRTASTCRAKSSPRSSALPKPQRDIQRPSQARAPVRIASSKSSKKGVAQYHLSSTGPSVGPPSEQRLEPRRDPLLHDLQGLGRRQRDRGDVRVISSGSPSRARAGLG